VSRTELAGVFEEIVNQALRREQGRVPAETLEAMTLVPRLLAELFAAPVTDGLRVIEGGKEASSGNSEGALLRDPPSDVA
jgi:hypothetical protein